MRSLTRLHENTTQNKTEQNKIQPCGTAEWPSQAWRRFWRPVPKGRSLAIAVSEGNATVSNRKLKEIWQTIVGCSFNAHSAKQPVGISSALRKVTAMWGTGTVFPF